MRLTADAHGVSPIAPTPFLADGTIDHASTDRLGDFPLACGSSGIPVLGQAGEAPTREHGESVAVAARFGRAAALPVIVGVSAPGGAAMRALAHDAMDADAAGVTIAPPDTLCIDDPIAGDDRQAIEAIGAEVPFVIQDDRLTFGVQTTPAAIRRVVSEDPGRAMREHEQWPGLEKITTLRGDDRDGSADGAHSGCAFPDMLCDVVRPSQAGRREEAHDLFDAHLPLLRCEQQPGGGPAASKYLLMRRGLPTSDAQRTPAATLSVLAKAEGEHLRARPALHDPHAALGAPDGP